MTQEDLCGGVKNVFGPEAQLLNWSPSLYSSTYPIHELEVERGGEILSVILKNLSPAAILFRVRPAFLVDPHRELDLYSLVLPRLRVGTPAFYGSLYDSANQRFWLFIEKVAGVELFQIGEFETWLDVARWLARFHSNPGSHPPLLRGSTPRLHEHTPERHAAWFDRAKTLYRDRLEPFAGAYRNVVEVLANLPVTLIHGEFYASNIIIQEAPLRVCPIDWEMAAIGPSLLDLAALISGNWSSDQRRRIATAYASCLASHLRPREFDLALACCRVQVAVQWLGWSDKWTPPVTQAWDWLQELQDLFASDELRRFAM